MMKLSSICIFMALAIVLTGTSMPQEKSARDSRTVYSELAKAPPKDAARRNPLEHDSDAIAAGAKLFARHCAECHGETAEGGNGKKSGPSLRAAEVQQATPGTLFWLLTNGVVRRGMPVWSRLPEPQRWQLVTFIKSLGSSAEMQVPKPQTP